jgi:hypothetical protein
MGYDAQQTSEPEDPDRPDNLWNPPPGDYGAHGRFDSRARRSSLQFWLARHKHVVTGAAAAGLAAFAGWRRLTRAGA